MTTTYFAADGNYGDAEGLVMIDTTDWTEDEWMTIEYSPENERIRIAQELSREINDQPTLFDDLVEI